MAAMGRNRVTVEESLGARCRDCGYALHGLTARRCPECGREFDPDDPWTVRLPRRPNRLAELLAQPPGAGRRWLPLLVVVAFACAASVPGWEHRTMLIAFGILLFALVPTPAWWLAIRYLRRRGYDVERPCADFRRWVRKLGAMSLVIVLLLALRPTMYVRFWISRPWLDRVARTVLAQPFEKPAPRVRAVRGLYYVNYTRRCPHGVKIAVSMGWGVRDGDPGFVYFPAPTECTRFDRGLPLGGGWYVSD